MKVLIVEESAAVHSRLKTLLSSIAEITALAHVRQVSEALHVLSALAPDAVISGLFFQLGSGVDVLHALKQQHPAPLAILMMDSPTDDLRDAYVAEGADFVFDKATELEDVVRVLTHALRSRHRVS